MPTATPTPTESPDAPSISASTGFGSGSVAQVRKPFGGEPDVIEGHLAAITGGRLGLEPDHVSVQFHAAGVKTRIRRHIRPSVDA